MAQSQNDVSIKLNGISFNLDKFRIDLQNPDPDINKGFLSIGRMNFGFSDIEMSLDEFDNASRSTFSFKGPNFTLDNLDFNIDFESLNPWKTLTKEFNLSQNNTKAYASDAKTELKNILMNAKLYAQQTGDFPEDIDQMIEDGYMILSESVKYKWEFDISGLELLDVYGWPGGEIKATSLENMGGGAGKEVTYNVTNGEWTGYGQNDDPYTAQNKSRNEINFHLGGIELLFASQGSFDMNNNNKLVEFQLDKAFFRVSNAKVDFMSKNIPNSKLTVKIMDYHIDLDNIFFELNNSNDVPKVEKFSGEIALNNLEIQIPDEIYMQPGFKQLSTLFGMRTNIFRLRQIAMKVRFIDNNNYQLDATVYSPFATISMNGNFLIHQKDNREPDVYINNLSFSVPHLSRGLNDLVTQWENMNNQQIPRKAGAIFIELSGEPDNIQVKGLDLEKLRF